MEVKNIQYAQNLQTKKVFKSSKSQRIQEIITRLDPFALEIRNHLQELAQNQDRGIRNAVGKLQLIQTTQLNKNADLCRLIQATPQYALFKKVMDAHTARDRSLIRQLTGIGTSYRPVTQDQIRSWGALYRTYIWDQRK